MPAFNSTRIFLHPGWVRSADGDRHLISGAQLAKLYDLQLRDCIIVADTQSYRSGHRAQEGDVHLWPRQNGDYANHLLSVLAQPTKVKEPELDKTAMMKVIVISYGSEELIIKPDLDLLFGQLEAALPDMGDWELGEEYTISMQEIPQIEFDALPEFDGF